MNTKWLTIGQREVVSFELTNSCVVYVCVPELVRVRVRVCDKMSLNGWFWA